MSSVWFDEAKDISSHTLDAMSYGFTGFDPASGVQAQRRPDLQPLEVACSACGAPPMERCNRGADPRTGKKRHRGFHFRRKDDARLATEAVRALNLA